MQLRQALLVSGRCVSITRPSRSRPRSTPNLCQLLDSVSPNCSWMSPHWGVVRLMSPRRHHCLFHNSSSKGRCIALHVHNLCLSSLLSIFQGLSYPLRRGPSMEPFEAQLLKNCLHQVGQSAQLRDGSECVPPSRNVSNHSTRLRGQGANL